MSPLFSLVLPIALLAIAAILIVLLAHGDEFDG